MKKENTLTITTEDGKEIVCQILFTHKSEEFNKEYVVFAQEGSDEVTAASYEADDSNESMGKLNQITTDAEWELLERLLEEFVEENQGNESEHHGCGGGGCCGGDCDSDEDCGCGE